MSWTEAASVPPPPPTPGDILRKAPKWVQVLMFILAAVWIIMVLAMLVSGSFNLLGFVVQLPVLTLLTIPLARYVARRDRDPEMVWFVMAAFSAKMLGGLVRYYFTYVAYVSAGDAEEYDAVGKYLAPFYRSLDFSPPIPTGPIPGTGFLETVTGILYSITGSSKLGAFAFFAWLGFLGLLLCWRAFCRAVPNGDRQRYGLLVLFLPSLLYWSSALGKDAWALFGLGLCAYGVARCLTRKPISGLAFLITGLWAVVMIRPHVGLTVFAGLVLAALLYKPHKTSALNPIVRVITFGILFFMMVVLISQTEQFLGVETLNQETVNTTLSDAEGRTSKESVGSVYTPVRVNTPLDLPYATITVLFRPFPWESHNGQALATSFESFFIIFLCIKGCRRLMAIPKTAPARVVHRVLHRHHVHVRLRVLVVLELRDPGPAAMSGHAVLPRPHLSGRGEEAEQARADPDRDGCPRDRAGQPVRAVPAIGGGRRRDGAEFGLDGGPGAGRPQPPRAWLRRAPSPSSARRVPVGGDDVRLALLGFDVEIRASDAGMAELLADLFAPLRVPGTAEHVLRSRRARSTTGRSGGRCISTASACCAPRRRRSPSSTCCGRRTGTRSTRPVTSCSSTRPRPRSPAARSCSPVRWAPGSRRSPPRWCARARATSPTRSWRSNPATGLVRAVPEVPLARSRAGGPGARTAGGAAQLHRRPAAGLARADPRRARSAAADSAAAWWCPALRARRGASVEPLRPPAALAGLAQHAFHLEADGPRVLATLAATVEQSSCFALVSGDVDEARDALLTLLDDARAPVAS